MQRVKMRYLTSACTHIKTMSVGLALITEQTHYDTKASRKVDPPLCTMIGMKGRSRWPSLFDGSIKS